MTENIYKHEAIAHPVFLSKLPEGKKGKEPFVDGSNHELSLSKILENC